MDRWQVPSVVVSRLFKTGRDRHLLDLRGPSKTRLGTASQVQTRDALCAISARRFICTVYIPYLDGVALLTA